MSEWFTVEKIDSQTFAISEYKHWEETHCYLLCGEESAVLIDTGLGVSNIREIVDTTGKPEVCPTRSSRTSVRATQISYAHDR